MPPAGKDFQGKRLKVSMARRKPMMGMGMQMPMRDGRGGMMGRGGEIGVAVGFMEKRLRFTKPFSHL